MTSFKYNSIIPGLLLLLLAISGNFLADTYSCNLQKIFHTNILYKNFLVFLLMYFTIYFTEQKVENPLYSFIKTIIAYAFYLIFTKQMPSTLLISLTLLDLSSNELKVLPGSIEGLTNLKELNVEGNKLKSLPEWIVNLINLEELNLGHNKFDVYPENTIRTLEDQGCN